MFTVTWKEWEYEEVFQVTRVWIRKSCGPSTPANASCPRYEINDTLGVEFPDGDVRIFANGKFFVMNEQGRTVATYSIGNGDSCPDKAALTPMNESNELITGTN